MCAATFVVNGVRHAAIHASLSILAHQEMIRSSLMTIRPRTKTL
jgi:hypothetical protein